jgi:hypothetical protein
LTDLEIARDLRRAADKLRRYGWSQDPVSYGTPYGPRCLVGAIVSVVGEGYLSIYSQEETPPCDNWAMVLALAPGMTIPEARLIDWNDVPGRTLDEVLDRLESTALGLEVRALASDQPAEELVAVGV